MCSISQMALIVVIGALGTPLRAQDGLCGTYTVDDLLQDSVTGNSELLGEHQVNLIDGVVFGTPIADVTSGMALYRVDDKIGMIISGGGMDGSMEVQLDKVPIADALDFGGSGFAVSLEDMSIYSDCSDFTKIPQYFGNGQMLTPDGQSVPATVRMVMWIGAGTTNGSSDQSKQLYAFGVVRSEVLNGKFYVN